ncbi:Uncharacterized protein FWK35_00021125 [Aphis craccivora]|uniref:Uncharacterized protein n=1 Tax=Aphis craccivora TaxID=307492 RepID=A0A6G0VRR3_APHCR|nr:Uncharacterized protein FWK35_00021125 [Aphis craccivora]
MKCSGHQYPVDDFKGELELKQHCVINETSVNTIPINIPYNIMEQCNKQTNLESLNNQLEEQIFPIIAHQLSNHANMNVGCFKQCSTHIK